MAAALLCSCSSSSSSPLSLIQKKAAALVARSLARTLEEEQLPGWTPWPCSRGPPAPPRPSSPRPPRGVRRPAAVSFAAAASPGPRPRRAERRVGGGRPGARLRRRPHRRVVGWSPLELIPLFLPTRVWSKLQEKISSFFVG